VSGPRITIPRALIGEVCAHAREASPRECCGLLGGRAGVARSVYRLTNVAADAVSAYEGEPRELFAAQRLMRERGEELLAIYHSHPRAADPTPSERDVRSAYYPQAIHLIVGLAAPRPVVRAFRLFESERRWEGVEYEVCEE
jgi:[CysO sulfur-carrier protein]-S-L-cysteine hydrolase